MSSFFPLNANDDGRAPTWSWGSFESALMSSSLMPSLRYSSCGAPLTFTNGSTAIDWPVRPAKAGVPCDRDSTRSPAAAATRVTASPAPAARRDVRRPVSRTPCAWLRAHVARRPERDPRLSQAPTRGRGDRPRDPEIAHHGMAGFEEDVLRLDVAMHDIMAVGVAQGVRNLARDLHRLGDRELACSVQPIPQRLSFDVGHHVIQQTGGFARIVERQDVRVREAGRDFDLLEKPLRAERRGELGLQHLDSDPAMMLEVLSEIDRRHPAAPQLTLDRLRAAL